MIKKSNITIADSNCAYQIAFLHFHLINNGFLPKLGISFLESLYKFLIDRELVLVYKEQNTVSGFVSCSISSKGIMKRFIISNPGGVLKVGWSVLKNPSLLKPLIETFRAPSLSVSQEDNEKSIPDTELLSIAVSPGAQQKGIGSNLLDALEEELHNRGIKQYKVIAGQIITGANKFYRKNGFNLAYQIIIHKNDVSNVYIKTL